MMLIIAILPVVVTMGFGMVAGRRQQFPSQTSSILIQLVMHYALPLSLFGGILSLKRLTILQNGVVATWLAIGMLGGLGLLLLEQRLTRQPLTAATLRALSVASPSIPFMGTSVLLIVFGKVSVLLVALGGLYMNLIQVPVSVLLLTLAGGTVSSQRWRAGWAKLVTASRQPVVWAPILAFILNLAGLRLPTPWLASFSELGQAAGGVALFALGMMLAAQKWHLTGAVMHNVVAKNLGLPLLIWGGMVLFKTPVLAQQLVVLTMAIPTAAIPTMLAVQNHVPATEYVATQLCSTLLAPVTMALMIWGLQIH
ncbi:AEC family transporter [Lactiplantibacillus carotarum]|uniref:AEC family transporter n=1 Tax=Lactiplantibacillus carotarum TaxID=2993456 RepID=UPI00298EE000|nr:AEC family transporter [Lactiplantibacillus carotarum]